VQQGINAGGCLRRKPVDAKLSLVPERSLENPGKGVTVRQLLTGCFTQSSAEPAALKEQGPGAGGKVKAQPTGEPTLLQTFQSFRQPGLAGIDRQSCAFQK